MTQRNAACILCLLAFLLLSCEEPWDGTYPECEVGLYHCDWTGCTCIAYEFWACLEYAKSPYGHAHAFNYFFEDGMCYTLGDRGSRLCIADEQKGWKRGPSAFDGEHLWAAADRELLEISPGGREVGSVRGPASAASGLAWDGECLWVADKEEERLLRISREGTIIDAVEITGRSAGPLSWDGSFLWFVDLRDPSALVRMTTDGRAFSRPELPEELADAPDAWASRWGAVYKLELTLSNHPQPGVHPRSREPCMAAGPLNTELTDPGGAQVSRPALRP